MIFAIDVGNTHLVAGCLDETGAHHVGRFETDKEMTAEEYAIKFKTWTGESFQPWCRRWFPLCPKRSII